MKKDKTMVKNSFVSGAFMVTLGIFISKLLGVIYVIPFHAVIGELGGALYGYAYTIYLFFISISTAGIPLAISKIVSEYQALGYYNAKKRAFALGKKLAFILGLVCFIFLMIFAPFLANLIVGDLVGGNTIEDITFVIRVVSSAILVVPILSIYRGYFEGHRFMNPPSISQILEQLVRIFVIVVGSYVMLNVFKKSLASAVGVAVFGATAGSIMAYFYLVEKRLKNKSRFNEKIRKINEPIVTDKQIIRKIIYYAFPLVMIDFFKSLYVFVDTMVVVNALVKYAKFNVKDAEVVMSMMSTWATKFNMIIASIATGLVVSLIPNLTQSIVNKDKKDVNKKINQSIGICLFLTLPMTLGISILAPPIWNLFYGKSIFGANLLSYFIFTGLFSSLFILVVSITQVFKDYKCLFVSLVSGIIVKILFNTTFIISFYKMGVPAYYGIITATILGYLVTILICLLNLIVKRKIHFENLLKNLIDIICGSILMSLILLILRFVIPIGSTNRITNIIVILVYAVIGMIIYFTFAFKTNVINDLFGNKINSYLNKKKLIK